MRTNERNEIVTSIIDNNNRHHTLSPYACHIDKAIRRHSEKADTLALLRNPFSHDIDRILHSHSYARYIDKTQVFSSVRNDHICRRSLHVQMVSRIARSIGRCLMVNEDLIEAIALGHDIGHTPFGHVGESILSKILTECGCGCFVHNAQSVRMLDQLEKNCSGLNLTLPVLDGIIGHNGENEQQNYGFHPENLTWEKLDANLAGCFSSIDYTAKVSPATLEGCVVRIADIISYLGKDFEDAISLEIIRRDELPREISAVLGDTNRTIICNLCDDLIINSYQKDHLEFSAEIFDACKAMKQFNFEHIYHCPMLEDHRQKVDRMMRALVEIYIKDIRNDRRDANVFTSFLNSLAPQYRETTPPERIAVDFIAGMTDQYFLKQYEYHFMPHWMDYKF